jgi:hypothetical protein
MAILIGLSCLVLISLAGSCRDARQRRRNPGRAPSGWRRVSSHALETRRDVHALVTNPYYSDLDWTHESRTRARARSRRR